MGASPGPLRELANSKSAKKFSLRDPTLVPATSLTNSNWFGFLLQVLATCSSKRFYVNCWWDKSRLRPVRSWKLFLGYLQGLLPSCVPTIELFQLFLFLLAKKPTASLHKAVKNMWKPSQLYQKWFKFVSCFAEILYKVCFIWSINCRCRFKLSVELSDPVKQGRTSELLLITQMLASAVLLSGWTVRTTTSFLFYTVFSCVRQILWCSSTESFLSRTFACSVRMFTFKLIFKKKMHISSLTRNAFAECPPSR